MLITRTPCRITLAGGGTDLPSFYEKHGGFVLSAAIDKYVYVMVGKHWKDVVWIGYNNTEIARKASEIRNNIVRSVLGATGITTNIEIASISDVPSNTGLGSSSSFTVGLLNALEPHRSKKSLAEGAYYIERILLKEYGGKQDQYISAYGGLREIHVKYDGDVEVDGIMIGGEGYRGLEKRLCFFYTGTKRVASEVQRKYSRIAEKGLIEIFSNACDTNVALEAGDFDEYGRLVASYWEIKKSFPGVSNTTFDSIYRHALKNGAIGGKLMGAGGGGFFMFICEEGKKGLLRDAMARKGLPEIPIKFNFSGSSVVGRC